MMKQRHIIAYLDGLQPKVNALRVLQSTSGEELSALMPSVLDKAFKGELNQELQIRNRQACKNPVHPPSHVSCFF
jgi:hypothetical protein